MNIWARGNYPKVADDLVAGLGPLLVESCGIGPGRRVLDVGAGCGNASIAAAALGAGVVASDLTPELLAEGRERAAARGLELEWVEADAEALPFADDEFDAVISCIGVMFAPDHRRAAGELLRVCRRGGTIGLLSWAPDGTVGSFFEVFGAHLPPVEQPADLCDYYKRHFGPTISAYETVRDDPQRLAALDRDFLRFAEHANRGGNGRTVYEFEYLVARGRKR
jgi:ubiquinone/menaquinone biosynthesis C-methylase UbiE